MATTVNYQIDVTKWAQVLVDNVGAGVVYYGLTQHAAAATSAPKWRVIKESTSGTVTTIAHAGWNEGNDQTQIWDNRASLTYPG